MGISILAADCLYPEAGKFSVRNPQEGLYNVPGIVRQNHPR